MHPCVAAALLLTVLATAGEAEPEPARRALLVGVEAYPEATGWPALAGPRADVEAVSRALVERAAFAPEDIELLLDEEATRERILGAFDALVEASGPGDLLLFYYAGHGSQLPDLASGEGTYDGEPDGYDETIVPYDAAPKGGPPRDVRDDDFAALIARANERTSNVVLLFDSCSSGTVVRGGEAGSRFVPPSSRGLAGARGSVAREEPDETGLYDDPELEYVALSACRSREKAFEHRLEDGRTHGLFTYCLLQELYRPLEGLTYEDLLTRVRRRVRALRPGQTPVLEGTARRRLLFGGEVAAREASFELRSEGGGWILAGGRVVGLTDGSRLDVFDWEATAPEPGSARGRVVIESVATTTAEVRWSGGEPEADALYRAFLVERGPEGTRLPVAVAASDGEHRDEARELRSALLATGLVRLAEPEDALLRVELVPAAAHSSWVVHDRGGGRLPLQARAGATGELALLVVDCATLARAHRLRADLAVGPAGGLQVEARFERVSADGRPLGEPERGADGALSVREGEHLATRLRNRSPFPVYAHLVVLTPDGGVEVIQAPETPDDWVAPGGVVRSPRLTVRLAEGTEPFYREGRDCLRWIVTRENADLSALEQRPVTNRTRGMTVGPRSRGAPALDAWATVSVDLAVRPELAK